MKALFISIAIIIGIAATAVYYPIQTDATLTGEGTVESPLSVAASISTGTAVLAGKAGGQTLYGGTAANEDLNLFGTSHATKTSSYITLQSSGGFVGIGTATPVTALNVVGTAASGTENVGRFDTGSQYGGFFLNNSSNRQARLLLGQGGTEKWQFGIDFAASGTADFYLYDNTAARNPLYITTGGDVRLGGTSGYSGTQAMTILQGGKVGVGTTAPDGKVEVNLGTSDAFRLSYNDANGSAANYMDVTLSSVGSPTFNATGTSPMFTFSDPIIIKNGTPSSAGDTGTAGQIAWDASYLYICTATNTWTRIALAW